MSEKDFDRPGIRIGGVARFSSIDYPGRLSAVLFCQGCPLKCPYCHNDHLQPVRACGELLRWDGVLDFLMERKGLLDAVVFSGGEPLMQKRLPAAVQDVKSMGYAVALHTAGVSPGRLEACLPYLDWVAFDVKAPFWNYGVVGSERAGRAVHDALTALLGSGVSYETRMTVFPPDMGRDAVDWACAVLPGMGVERFVIQRARKSGADGVEDYYPDDGVFSDRRLIDRLTKAFRYFEARDYAAAEGPV
ncbi:MAG: anaerobic ribonucleoside-triphosphate reductase activating protein [Parvularculaceae bacterium]